MNPFFIKCPHCDIYIEILELNCKIFRCGIYKNGLTQINPHMSKKEITKIINYIYGCGKPFKINEQMKPEICDYI
jgi:hypothetical protein